MFLGIKRWLIAKLRGDTPTEVLVKKGLKVGRNFKRLEGCIIDYSHAWLISIGDNVTFAPRVHILAHDASTKLYLGYTKIGRVHIGDNVFIGAGSIVLPGVTIGEGSIIGSGSVVTKDVPKRVVVAGNPARQITELDTFLEKNRNLMNERPMFDESYTERAGVDVQKKDEMFRMLEDGIGFVD